MNVGYVDAQGDEIDGADGLNDTIFGYGGDDTITAGQGDDWVIAGDGNDAVLAGTGADTVFGEAGNDTLSGGDDNDSLYGGAGADELAGDAGDDQLFGGADGDTLSGGLGMDTLSGDAGNDTLSGGDDDDDTLLGGAGDDSLMGDAGQDLLQGGDGNDTLISNDGMDTLLGEGGDDTFTLQTGFMSAEITGGETDETNGDTLDLSGLTTNTELYFGVAEGGMLINGTGTANFSEIENIVLGSGDDSVMGSLGADNVSLGAGADTVYGGEGDDTFDLGADGDIDVIQMYGMDGHDTLTGFDAPIDNMDGTFTGVDQFDVQYLLTPLGDPVDVSHVTVTDGGAGNAVLTFAGGEAVTLIGVDPVAAADPDYLVAMGIPAVPPTFIVDGTSGNDTIDAGYTGDLGGDSVDANDNQFLSNDDEIQAGAGDDLILSGDGMDMIFAGDGDDTIDGGVGDDMTFGEDGDDTAILNDGFGNDYFDGGATGETDGDTVDLSNLGTAANVLLDGDEFGSVTVGTDVLNFYDVENFTGTDFDDTMYGAASASGVNFDAGAGNDSLTGGIGDDSLLGGAGDDTLSGDEGADTLDGGLGDDWLFAGDGNDSVMGGDGNDSIFGQGGDDTIEGGAGIDEIYGDDGADSIDAGDGDDWVAAGQGNDFVVGGLGSDALNGGEDQDTLSGGQGNDYLSGDGGDDLVSGGDGDDTLDGGLGNDTLNGDVGRDTMFGGDGSDDIFGGADDDYLYGEAGTDSLVGGDGNDGLFGGADDDTLEGGDGSDTLDGGDGADLLSGGTGDDSLLGGAGNDTISGDAGSDTLSGGTGDDSLSGGSGADTLIGGDGADTLSGGDDRDYFIGGIGDVIDGGEGGDDFDTLDLTSLGGSSMTNVIYDVGNSENGTVEVLDGLGAVVGSFQFSNIETVIPCFTPGTMIRTDEGDVAVENLKAGARVQTRDNGYQTLRWVGRRDLSTHELATQPNFNPVIIKAGALGQGLPERDMTVSPQHRMLFVGPKAEMLFGQSEVLIAALHLVNDSTITRARPESVSYIHLLFDDHEIIIGDGAWTESYQLGEQTLDSMEAAQHEEILALFPELGQKAYQPAARISLKAYEAMLLCS